MTDCKQKIIYILETTENYNSTTQNIFSSLKYVELFLSKYIKNYELYDPLLSMLKISMKNNETEIKLLCSNGTKNKVYLYKTYMDDLDN